jgi:hypothetical protein
VLNLKNITAIVIQILVSDKLPFRRFYMKTIDKAKASALKVAKAAGLVRDIAHWKAGNPEERYVSTKVKQHRRKRNKIARQSRKANR